MQVRLGALVACAELLGGVAGAPDAAGLQRHLQTSEAASLVGYASSVFLQVRRDLDCEQHVQAAPCAPSASLAQTGPPMMHVAPERVRRDCAFGPGQSGSFCIRCLTSLCICIVGAVLRHGHYHGCC